MASTPFGTEHGLISKINKRRLQLICTFWSFGTKVISSYHDKSAWNTLEALAQTPDIVDLDLCQFLHAPESQVCCNERRSGFSQCQSKSESLLVVRWMACYVRMNTICT